MVARAHRVGERHLRTPTMTPRTDSDGGTVLKLGRSTAYKVTLEGAADDDDLAVKDTTNNELAQDKNASFKTKQR